MLGKEFWSHISDTSSREKCMRWNGQHTYKGSGLYHNNEVDRLIWEDKYGPIPDGFEIYHTCINNDCCNIHHMYIKPSFLKGERVEVETIRHRGGKRQRIERRSNTRRKPRAYQPRYIEHITSEELKETFDYKDDQLVWKIAAHGTSVGQPAGTVNRAYKIRTVSINSIKFRLEDLVWIYHNGPLYEYQRVVPVNGDTLDCRIENLHLIEVF